LTREGRKQLAIEEARWAETVAMIGRVLEAES
jgi:hypothetical protein